MLGHSLTLKKRLILTLYYDEEFFCLSRNFRLQKVGKIEWLLGSYPFSQITKAIDEITIINVSKSNFGSISDQFLSDIDQILANIFIPITLGGGLRKIEDVEKLFNFGSDKIILNRAILEEPLLVKEITDRYGSQSVVASIDFKKEGKNYYSYLSPGLEKGILLNEHIKKAEEYNIGELFLTSIGKDGTGQGYETDILSTLNNCKLPLIFSGGAGKPEHFLEVLKLKEVSAVATANLFNFLGNSLSISRDYLKESGILLRKR